MGLLLSFRARTSPRRQTVYEQVRQTVGQTVPLLAGSGDANLHTRSPDSCFSREEKAPNDLTHKVFFFGKSEKQYDDFVPHNRETSRRITSMGFVKDKLTEGLWMSTAGGELSKAAGPLDTNLINIAFNKQKIQSGGYGILDVAYVGDGTRAWSVGGGGTIFGSNDGGNNWKKDKSADNLPTNLYKIKFFGEKGYILGSNGVLLTNA